MTRPFGTHHCHYQPRNPDGTFLSYTLAGRRLGRDAVAQGHRVVVTAHGLQLPRVVRSA